jgi:hypothetical protein
MKAPWTDPGLRELLALAALAGLGCGLALAQGEFFFGAIFAAASALTIESLQRKELQNSANRQGHNACKLGLEGVVSKRKDSSYRSGRSPDWLKMKNSDAPAVKREAEEDWGNKKRR